MRIRSCLYRLVARVPAQVLLQLVDLLLALDDILHQLCLFLLQLDDLVLQLLVRLQLEGFSLFEERHDVPDQRLDLFFGEQLALLDGIRGELDLLLQILDDLGVLSDLFGAQVNGVLLYSKEPGQSCSALLRS